MDNAEAIKQISTRLDQQNELLNCQDKKLNDIQNALSQLAVQDEQINQLKKEQATMWKKFDSLIGNKGLLTKISNYQASCPRGQLKYLWFTVIPMGITQLAVTISIIKIALLM